MVARHVDCAGREIVAYNVASVDDDPAVARNRVRDALVVAGEPDWHPHVSMLDFASELAELRRSTGGPGGRPACRLGGSPRHRGYARPGAGQLAALRHSGTDRVVLSPAYPDLGASLDSLAQILRTADRPNSLIDGKGCLVAGQDHDGRVLTGCQASAMRDAQGSTRKATGLAAAADQNQDGPWGV